MDRRGDGDARGAGRRPSAPRHPPERPFAGEGGRGEKVGRARRARVPARNASARLGAANGAHLAIVDIVRRARSGLRLLLGAVLAEIQALIGRSGQNLRTRGLGSVKSTRARLRASGKDRTPHLPARRGAHLRALRGVFRGRGQGKHGSHQGLLHRTGPHCCRPPQGAHLPRGHQRRLRRLHLGLVLRHPTQRHARPPSSRAPRCVSAPRAPSTRPSPSPTRRWLGMTWLKKIPVVRNAAPRRLTVSSGISHVPRRHQAHHLRG